MQRLYLPCLQNQNLALNSNACVVLLSPSPQDDETHVLNDQ